MAGPNTRNEKISFQQGARSVRKGGVPINKVDISTVELRRQNWLRRRPGDSWLRGSKPAGLRTTESYQCERTENLAVAVLEFKPNGELPDRYPPIGS